jgi:hypothetical protein
MFPTSPDELSEFDIHSHGRHQCRVADGPQEERIQDLSAPTCNFRPLASAAALQELQAKSASDPTSPLLCFTVDLRPTGACRGAVG